MQTPYEKEEPSSVSGAKCVARLDMDEQRKTKGESRKRLLHCIPIKCAELLRKL